ncbi:MAG: SurA N-terminal domain-containing protein [Candidatus Omnitrophota bacterium]
MKFKIKIIFFGLTLFFSNIFTLNFFVQAQEITKIIAKVNDQAITSKDLDDYCKVLTLKFSLEDQRPSSEDKDFKAYAFERFIEDKLVLAEAKKDDIKIPRFLVDDKIKQMIASYPSREHFEQSLAEKGLTVTLLKEKITEQYLMREVIQKYARSLVNISPQQISSYYTSNENNFYSKPSFIFYIAKLQEKVVLEEISEFVQTKGIEEACKQYKDILLEVESSQEELREDVAKILEGLKDGECAIAEIETEFCLVYLKRTVEAHLNPLEEVQEQIYSYLWNKEFTKTFSEWIKGLKEKAVIKRYYE